jgi:hypothetical protein
MRKGMLIDAAAIASASKGGEEAASATPKRRAPAHDYKAHVTGASNASGGLKPHERFCP